MRRAALPVPYEEIVPGRSWRIVGAHRQPCGAVLQAPASADATRRAADTRRKNGLRGQQGRWILGAKMGCGGSKGGGYSEQKWVAGATTRLLSEGRSAPASQKGSSSQEGVFPLSGERRHFQAVNALFIGGNLFHTHLSLTCDPRSGNMM
jgi:hypothetical protein